MINFWNIKTLVSYIENDFTTKYKLAMIKLLRLEQSQTWYKSENWTDISSLMGIRFSRDTPKCTLRVIKMGFRGSTRPKSKITTINFYLHWNHYVISGYRGQKSGIKSWSHLAFQLHTRQFWIHNLVRSWVLAGYSVRKIFSLCFIHQYG